MDEEKNSSRFFRNTECQYFPCHKGIAEKDFNCLFCYCPLYVLGRNCGGNWHYTDKGVKSCKSCAFPHQRDHFDRVVARFPEILEALHRMEGEAE